jgi:hypothetical protein
MGKPNIIDLINSEEWKACVEFIKKPIPLYHQRPWPTPPISPFAIKPKPPIQTIKRTRRRQLTLDRAMRQANKAGITVKSATLTPDGVKLDLGDQANSDQPNPWDSVQ